MDQTELQAEHATLSLPAFDELSALRLGQILVDLALAEGLPVVIDIRTPDRTLFHAALPGSAPLNDIWARRKSNTALIFQLPSLLVGRRNAANSETLARHGLSAEDHADAGGAVPIRVDGVGVVAVATVSGLPQVEDHRLVVRGIRALIERGRAA
ncbi:MAG: heme-degrading domain-containing protein [Tabrizicola sp.]